MFTSVVVCFWCAVAWPIPRFSQAQMEVEMNAARAQEGWRHRTGCRLWHFSGGEWSLLQDFVGRILFSSFFRVTEWKMFVRFFHVSVGRVRFFHVSAGHVRFFHVSVGQHHFLWSNSFLLFWLHYRMGLEGNPSPLEAWTMRPRQQLFLFIPATTLLSPNLKGWETHLDMFFLKHDFDANLTFRVDLYGKHVNGTHRYITLHYPLPRWARPFFHVPCPVYPPFFAGEIPSFQCCPPFTHLWAHSTDCRFPLMIDAWVPIEYIYIYTL